MKKTITETVDFCDGCGNRMNYAHRCLNCGTEHCFDCEKNVGRQYKFAVHFSGSHDGYYCKPCDDKLTKAGDDTLHNAYVTIAALRQEEKEWHNYFEGKHKPVQELIESLRDTMWKEGK